MVCRDKPPSLNRPFLFFSHLSSYLPFLGYTTREKDGLARTLTFFKSGNAYNKQQSTKPQTLGYGLADSPVGLLAWIYEKLIGWTDAYPWEDDEGALSNCCICFIRCLLYYAIVLTWISVYQFSRARPAASLRIYYEFLQRDRLLLASPNIPVGYSYFPKEIMMFPRRYVC